MKTFSKTIKRFLGLKYIGEYRLCWIELNKKGDGLYSIIEFTEDELLKLNKQIIILIK